MKPGIGLVNSELGMRNAEVGKSEPQNRRISNVECRRMVSLRSVYYIKASRLRGGGLSPPASTGPHTGIKS